MIPRRAARAKKEPEIIRSRNTNVILSSFRGLFFNDKVSFVVFENPGDFPGAYIVRLFYADGEKKPSRYITISETLDGARETIPVEELKLVSVPRQENENETIVEIWMQEEIEMHTIDIEFAMEIHKNAVSHGWWEEDRSELEIEALIHSEWSEALEEYRDGKPAKYYNSPDMKPEGIAVELADGCIRILDFLAYRGDVVKEIEQSEFETYLLYDSIPEQICKLHEITSSGYGADGYMLAIAYFTAREYIRALGVDPDEIMQEKHLYNKTRPYKHGGKKC